MNEAFVLHVSYCLTPMERIPNASILFRDGRIQSVGGSSAMRGFDDILCIDLPACHAIPGLVDTHIHGTGNFDVMGIGDDADTGEISRVLATHGVTSFLPTVLSAPQPDILEVIARSVRACARTDHPGAVPVGLHLEGPYINREKRGAQQEAAIRPVDLGEARELLQAGQGFVRIMTFAPELDHSRDLVALLRENQVVPSMGHTTACDEDVFRAVEAGANRCTHLFNGMPPLDQRRVGLSAVALTEDRIMAELIVDGVHVHPRMVDVACRAKPRHQVVAVSDSVQGTGLGEGIYRLGHDPIQIQDGVSRRLPDGVLAGACMPLYRAMHNLLRFSSLTQSEAVACCTVNAARGIGLADRGEIRPGKRGDVVVVNDREEVEMTIVSGRVVYDRRGVAAPQETRNA